MAIGIWLYTWQYFLAPISHPICVKDIKAFNGLKDGMGDGAKY
jgi:hypothetical protein